MRLLLVLCLLLVVLAMLLLVLARRLRPSGSKLDTTQFDFSLEELIRLRREGVLSDEQFERARESILSRRPSEPNGSSQPGFDVVQRQRPTVQPLEDRLSP